MVYRWYIYGISLVYLWYIHGLSMGHPKVKKSGVELGRETVNGNEFSEDEDFNRGKSSRATLNQLWYNFGATLVLFFWVNFPDELT
jgi:hypothetical protein